MDYDFLLNNSASFTEAEFIKYEPYLYAALRYGNKSANTKKADKRNGELPVALTALITLGVWAEASHETAQFYGEHNSADIKTTKQYLKSGADKELAEIFACGIHDYKNPNNARFVNDWIVQSYAIEKWINANADNRKKLDSLRYEIFTENINAIQSIIRSADIPFNEALKSFANELRVCLIWQCRLNRCAADNGDAEAKYNLSEFYHYAPEKSLEYLTAAAAQGYAKAQCKLGTYYCEQKNFTEAVKWFSLAGGQYVEALSALGKMYLNGNGVKKDLRRAIELFENAAKCGDAEAYLYLARAYESGEGKEKDCDQAIEYYSVAAVLGNAQARERLNAPDYLENESNIKKLKPLAKKGNAYAIYALSCFWDASGDEASRERDAKKAAEIWKKQADAGDAEAQYLLGLCYLDGTGVEEDATKALGLFESAAGNGYAHALTEIGDMYKHGNGVEFSDRKGNEYYLGAAELGDSDAMTSLGRAYCEGYGVEADIEKGVAWLKKAADGDDSDAYTLLAYWLDELGDKESARAWRIKAAALGDTTAQYCLAENLLKGTKTEQRLKGDDVKEYINYLFYFDRILDAIEDRLPD